MSHSAFLGIAAEADADAFCAIDRDGRILLEGRAQGGADTADAARSLAALAPPGALCALVDPGAGGLVDALREAGVDVAPLPVAELHALVDRTPREEHGTWLARAMAARARREAQEAPPGSSMIVLTTAILRRAQHDPSHASWHDLARWIERRVRRWHGGERGALELDELVADVLERVARGLVELDLRGRDRFWGWVRKVAQHAAVDRARARARAPESLSDRAGSSLDPRLPDERAPAASAIARGHEMQRALLECIDALPEAQADVLRLRLVEDLPYERIAALLELDETYARTVFRRARQRVAACLARRGFD